MPAMGISTKEPLRHTRPVLDAMERGEDVPVIYPGQSGARAVRFDTELSDSGSSDTPLFGLWSDRDDLDNPTEHVRELPQHANH